MIHNGRKSLNFLDINITNIINNKYELKNHAKKAITSMHIYPIPCLNLNTIKSVFNGFLHIAQSICLKKHIREEKNFLIDMFVENGHNKQVLKKLVVESKR